MTKTIIALDPGGTTGWAMWRDNHFTCGQIGPAEHHLALYEFLGREQTGELTVVCESFEFRQGKQRANIVLDSKEYIGVVKLFHEEQINDGQDVKLHFQTAGQAKSFVSDEKLRKMGLYHTGMKHAMDAMRHLVTYMVNKERRYDLIESWKNL
jgi:hypothetical protein